MLKGPPTLPFAAAPPAAVVAAVVWEALSLADSLPPPHAASTPPKPATRTVPPANRRKVRLVRTGGGWVENSSDTCAPFAHACAGQAPLAALGTPYFPAGGLEARDDTVSRPRSQRPPGRLRTITKR